MSQHLILKVQLRAGLEGVGGGEEPWEHGQALLQLWALAVKFSEPESS